MEEFKDYFGYKVFRNGTILNLDGSVKTTYKVPKGYLLVIFRTSGKARTTHVHRILAELWIPNPENLSDVDHINGIRDDNRLENLRWLSHSDNIRHSYNTGRRNVKGDRNANSKHTTDQIVKLCELFQETGCGPKRASEITGIARGTCNKVHNREQWSTISKDYTWPQRSETRPQGRRCEVASKQETP